ncbi:MAG TPA: hypothetical protein VIG44_10090, partial [Thermomicrobiales bacterium]
MHRRYMLPIPALLIVAALLTACGGGKTIDTPVPATPTAAPTTAPTAPAPATASAATVARPASPAATNAPTSAADSASAFAGTRPASAITTGSAPADTAIVGSVAAGTGVAVFTDPRGRFSFSRPAAWMVGQSSATNSVVQFNTTNPSGVVDISTESVSSGVTPEQYLDGALAEIKRGIPDARQVGTTQVQLDTEPAVQIDYTGTISG